MRISDLKAGDEVVICRGRMHRAFEPRTVARVTSLKIVLDNGAEYRRSDGFRWGSGIHSYFTGYLDTMSHADITAIKEKQEREALRKSLLDRVRAQVYDLTDDQLAQVLTWIESKK